MKQDEIEIRPIVQITGGSEFNEVFFNNAKTQEDLVVGESGNGWAVAMGTLAFERGASTLGQQTSFSQELDELIQIAKQNGAIDEPLIRQELVKSFSELQIMRFNQMRMLSSLSSDSAGANLATVVCQMSRDRNGPEIKHQMLFYGCFDIDPDRWPSHTENGEGYILDREMIRWFYRNYVGSEKFVDESYASPIRAESLSGLPPAQVITAIDSMHSSGIVIDGSKS